MQYDFPEILYSFPVLRLAYDIQWNCRYFLCVNNIFRHCESLKDCAFVLMMTIASKIK